MNKRITTLIHLFKATHIHNFLVMQSTGDIYVISEGLWKTIKII